MPVGLGRSERLLDGAVALRQCEHATRPGPHVAAFRRRAADQVATGVHAIVPEPPRNARRGLCHEPEGGRGPHIEGDAVGPDAPRAEIRAGPVSGGGQPQRVFEGGPATLPWKLESPDRRVVDGRQLAGGHAGRLEHGGIPGAARLVEESRARGHGQARGEAPRHPQQEVLGESADGGSSREPRGFSLAEPGQLGGEEGGVKRRARARVDRGFVEPGPERLGGCRAPGVGPGEDGREGSARSVEQEQAVPESRRADGGGRLGGAGHTSIDGARHRLQEMVGVELDPAIGGEDGLIRNARVETGDGAGGRVIADGARGARAHIQRQNPHGCGIFWATRRASGHGFSPPREGKRGAEWPSPSGSF